MHPYKLFYDGFLVHINWFAAITKVTIHLWPAIVRMSHNASRLKYAMLLNLLKIRHFQNTKHRLYQHYSVSVA